MLSLARGAPQATRRAEGMSQVSANGGGYSVVLIYPHTPATRHPPPPPHPSLRAPARLEEVVRTEIEHRERQSQIAKPSHS